MSENSLSNRQNKILIITRWFTPGVRAGGVIRTMKSMATNLSKHYEIYVLTSNVDFNSQKTYDLPTEEWIESEDGYQIKYLPPKSITRSKLLNAIQALAPDYIYLKGINEIYFNFYIIWLKSRKKINAKLILAPSGMLAPSALHYKAWKKRPYLLMWKILRFQKLIKWHATNETEAGYIRQVFGKNISMVVAALFPPLIPKRVTPIEKERGQLKVLFLSRIHPIKGLKFLLDLFENKMNGLTKIELNIVGPIEDENYWMNCKRQGERLPKNIKFAYHGKLLNKDVPEMVQKNHVLILPTQGENFGFVIIEALSSGRPVLISNRTPWVNLDKSMAGWDLPLENPLAFKIRIEQLIEMDQNEFDNWCIGAWNFAKQNHEKSDLIAFYHLLFS